MNGREVLVGSFKFFVLYKGVDFVMFLFYVIVLGFEGVLNEIVLKESIVYVKVCLFFKFIIWRWIRVLNVLEKLVFKDYFIILGVKLVDLEEVFFWFVVVCVREDE